MAKKKKKTGSQSAKQKKPRRAAQKGSRGRSASSASTGGGSGSGGGGSSGGSSGGGGGLMGMRSGIKGLVSGKASDQPKSALSKAMDVGFWILLAAVLVFILYARLFRDAG